MKPQKPLNGWWPSADLPDAIINNELLVDGFAVACVMSFYEDAPCYGIASAPEAVTLRSGAVGELAAAKDWCERVAGLKPRTERDSERIRAELSHRENRQ